MLTEIFIDIPQGTSLGGNRGQSFGVKVNQAMELQVGSAVLFPILIKCGKIRGFVPGCKGFGLFIGLVKGGRFANFATQ